jgi:ferredoxin
MSFTDLSLPTIDRQRCTGCRACIEVCPTNALGQVAERAALVDPSACIWCARCEEICPTNAIGLPYVIRFGDKDPPWPER